MEVGLRSLVLRSECVSDGVRERECWARGGQSGYHLMIGEARYHSWMLSPWW